MNTNTKSNVTDTFGQDFTIIHTYTRAQALEDGVLVDVSQVAREAGILFPVALTRAVWDRYVAVPEGVTGQDEAGRLWDIVWMTRIAIVRSPAGTDRLTVALYVRNDNRHSRLVKLKALCGPGDHAEPVITIMLPEED